MLHKSINCKKIMSQLAQKTFNVLSFNWIDVAPLVRNIIPPLLHSEHKGSMGRIGIIGGSRDYTGAPFYAADAALKFGADLSFVFASKEACGPIKSYSPELMVSPLYQDDYFDYQSYLQQTNPSVTFSQQAQEEINRAKSVIEAALPRLNTLVIGPGLGRNDKVLQLVCQIVALAKEKDIQLVLDADAITLFDNSPSLLQGYSRCILTPNAMEFTRLVGYYVTNASQKYIEKHALLFNELQSTNILQQVRAMSILLGGVTILRKGEADVVSNGDDVYVLEDKGSPRRCGGQGDILAGSIAVAFNWAVRKKLDAVPTATQLLDTVHSKSVVETEISLDDCEEQDKRMHQAAIASTILATSVVKQASVLAFQQYKRSMTAPNVLEKLGEAFSFCEES